MRRFLVWSAIALAGLALVVGVVAFAIGWDGTWRYQTLHAGESVTLESGLTLTVPPGFEGFHSKFVHIPSWIPLGEGATGLQRSEDFIARPASRTATSTIVMYFSFYGDGRPPVQFKTLVAGGDVTLLGPVGNGPAGAKVSLPGHTTGWLITRATTAGPEPTIRAMWRQFAVRGAELP